RVLITSGIVRIIRSHAAGQYLVRSMSSHFDAGHDSKRFCQMLYRNLAAKIPNMEREETEQWCSLRASGGNKFAWISHRKRMSRIEIWCAGDVQDLMRHSKIEVHPRGKIKRGWERKFPARIFVDEEADVSLAADLLYRVSHPAA